MNTEPTADDSSVSGRRSFHASASRSDADALIMFGLTGDLGEKKLFPALYELAAAGRLGIPVVGVGRSEYSDDDLREMMSDALDGHSPADGSEVDPEVVRGIDLRYLSGDSTEADTYDDLVEMLDGTDRPVVYAALPPDLFGGVAHGIAASALPESTKLVSEKPFGEDADSARRLYDEVTAALGDDRLFIVDHFLAKSAIENMLTVRTANAFVDNSMGAPFVESVEIEMRETGGVDGRGSFYEGVGAVDDVLQNHLMEALALLMMEAPSDATDEAYDRARTSLLRSVRAIDADDVVLGQYDGYRDLDDVDDDSRVETYVEVGLFVDNDRWRGVPVRIRSGKRLDEDRTTATITLADTASGPVSVRNRIVFQIKPDPLVEFDLGVLDPNSHEPVSVPLELGAADDHGALGDYAVMLDNAMSGVTRHFAHIDGIVEAWRIVADVRSPDGSPIVYQPGSNGPGERVSL